LLWLKRCRFRPKCANRKITILVVDMNISSLISSLSTTSSMRMTSGGSNWRMVLNNGKQKSNIVP
jgi:hypothetical protein